MSIPAKALELENLLLDKEGNEAATLAAACEILEEEWRRGNRDRELALHLMFLAWYGMCEPAYLTGFETQEGSSYMLKDGLSDELRTIFQKVHDCFRPSISQDPEMLYVVGLMAHLFPYLLGDCFEWDARSIEYRKRYRTLRPDGISPGLFKGRGAYGDHFAYQAKGKNGY